MPLTTEDVVKTINAQYDEIKKTNATAISKIDGIEARFNEWEQRAVRRGGGNGPVNSWGQQVTDSDGYKAFLADGARGTKRIQIKNALTSVPTSAGAMIAPDYKREVVALPHQRLTVRNLLSPGRTESNLVQYTRMTSYTNAARVVSEGALKPESDMQFELAEAPVRTLAHILPVSRQAMDDASQLQSLIDTEMRYGLALSEELEMLFGDGSGQHLYGLVPQASSFSAPFTIISENMLDTLLLAIAQAQQTKIPATGVIVNDLDWKRMQAIKDGEGRYIGAGPFGSAINLAWQVPVVDTPAMPEGSFLVGAFAFAAQIFDRLDPEVLVSSEDSDNFRRNLLTVRCEERLAMAVKRPSALIYGTYPAYVT